MSEEMALAASRSGEYSHNRKARPESGSKTERLVLYILGGVIGGLMLTSLGFLGLVTYVSLSSPEPKTPLLACPPTCKVEAR